MRHSPPDEKERSGPEVPLSFTLTLVRKTFPKQIASLGCQASFIDCYHSVTQNLPISKNCMTPKDSLWVYTQKVFIKFASTPRISGANQPPKPAASEK
jgi:hypothetical protein